MTEQKKRSEVENYGGMFDGDDDSWTNSHYLKQLSKSEGGPKDCCMQINRFLSPHSLWLLSWPLNWIIFSLWGSLAHDLPPFFDPESFTTTSSSGPVKDRIYTQNILGTELTKVSPGICPSSCYSFDLTWYGYKKENKISSENPLQASGMLTKARTQCLLSHSLPNNIWKYSKQPNKASLPTWRPGSQWDLHSVKSSLLV